MRCVHTVNGVEQRYELQHTKNRAFNLSCVIIAKINPFITQDRIDA